MNIIFDIGKVLIDFDFEGFVNRYLEPETAKTVVAAMWGSPAWNELDRGVLRDEEVLKLFIANAPQCEREIRMLFSKFGEIPVLRESAVPLIDRLKAQGHKVFYLSNYFEYLMHTAPDVLRFTSHMDGGVFSCFEKITKPDRAIYELICRRYSLDPAECVFIDDTEKNIRAAEEFGMRGIHFDGITLDDLEEIINKK